jgi:hypothetical protein
MRPVDLGFSCAQIVDLYHLPCLLIIVYILAVSEIPADGQLAVIQVGAQVTGMSRTVCFNALVLLRIDTTPRYMYPLRRLTRMTYRYRGNDYA